MLTAHLRAMRVYYSGQAMTSGSQRKPNRPCSCRAVISNECTGFGKGCGPRAACTSSMNNANKPRNPPAYVAATSRSIKEHVFHDSDETPSAIPRPHSLICCVAQHNLKQSRTSNKQSLQNNRRCIISKQHRLARFFLSSSAMQKCPGPQACWCDTQHVVSKSMIPLMLYVRT